MAEKKDEWVEVKSTPTNAKDEWVEISEPLKKKEPTVVGQAAGRKSSELPTLSSESSQSPSPSPSASEQSGLTPQIVPSYNLPEGQQAVNLVASGLGVPKEVPSFKDALPSIQEAKPDELSTGKPINVEQQIIQQKQEAIPMGNIKDLSIEDKENAFLNATDEEKKNIVQSGALTPDDTQYILDRELQRKDWPEQAKNAFVKSVGSLVTDMPQYANAVNLAVNSYLFGKDSTPVEVLKGVNKTINDTRKFVDEVFPTGEGLYMANDGRATAIDISGAAGSLLPFAAGGAVGSMFKYGSTLIPAILGGMQNAVPMYNEAITAVENVNKATSKAEYIANGGDAADYDKLKGQDPYDVALNSLIIFSGIGTLEAFSVKNMFKRAGKIIGDKELGNIVVNAAKGGSEEALQEATTQYLNNLTAREIYETQRKLDAGLYQAAGIGFLLGVFMNGSITALSNKINDKTLPESERIEAKIAYEKLSEEKAKMEAVETQPTAQAQPTEITPKEAAINRQSRREDVVSGMTDLETSQMVEKYGETIPTKAQVVKDFGVTREQAAKMIRKQQYEIETKNIDNIYNQIHNVEPSVQKVLLDKALEMSKLADDNAVNQAGIDAAEELSAAKTEQINKDLAGYKTASEQLTGTAKEVIDNKIRELEKETTPETAPEVAAKTIENGKEEKGQGLLSTPELLPEEKTNLTSIQESTGKNFREVQNVYAKYGEGKPLSEITAEDYAKAEAKRQESKAVIEPTGIEQAKAKLQEVKARVKEIKDRKKNLGITSDPFQQAKEEALADRELVDAYMIVAKEYVKKGVSNVADFAKAIGEDINDTLTSAWNRVTAEPVKKEIQKIIDKSYSIGKGEGSVIGEIEGQKKGFERGVKQGQKTGIKDIKSLQKSISEEIKTILSDKGLAGTINEKQREALVNKARSITSYNQLDGYSDYVDRVLSHADYVDTLAEAKQNRKDIRTQLKNAKFSNKTTEVASFLQIDPSIVEDIDKLKEYNQIASELKKGKVPKVNDVSNFIIRNEQLIKDSEIANAKSSKTLLSILDNIGKMEILSISDYYAAKRRLNELVTMTNHLVSSGNMTLDEQTEVLNGVNNAEAGINEKSATTLADKMKEYRDSVAEQVYQKSKNVNLEFLTKSQINLAGKYLKNASKESIEAMSLRDIELFNDVIDGLEDGFINKEAYNISNKIQRNVNKSRVYDTLDAILENNPSLQKELDKGKKLADKFNVGKVYRWDSLLNTGKQNRIYKTIYNMVATAEQKKVQAIKDMTKDYRKSVKNLTDAEATKIDMIKAELDYRSNSVKTPDGKVYEWKDLPTEYKNKYGFLLNDPASLRDTPNFTGKKKKLYNEAYNWLAKDENGVIDIEESIALLSKKEKIAYDESKKAIDSLTEIFNSLAENHGTIVPLRQNYHPSYNLQRAKGSLDIDSAESIAKFITDLLDGHSNNMSFKTGSIYERVGYSYITELDVRKTIETKIKETLSDYYLTNAVKNTFGAIDDVVRNTPNEKAKVLNVVRDAMKEKLITELNLRSQKDINVLQKAQRKYVGWLVKMKIAEPTKVAADIISNGIRMGIMYGKPTNGTLAYNPKFNQLLKDMGSSVSSRLNRFADDIISEKETKSSAATNKLITFGDTVIGRPYLASFVADSYKKSTGKDIKEVLEKELTYEEELEVQDAIADGEIKLAKALNSQVTMQSGTKVRLLPFIKPTDKKGMAAEAMGIMQGFSENETGTFLQSAKDLWTGNNTGRVSAARTIAALTASNYAYLQMRLATTQIILAAVVDAISDDEKDDFSMKEVVKTIVDTPLKDFFVSTGTLFMSRFSPVYKAMVAFGLGVSKKYISKNVNEDSGYTPEEIDKIKKQQADAEAYASDLLYAKPVAIGYGNPSTWLDIIPGLGQAVSELVVKPVEDIIRISGEVQKNGVKSLSPEEQEFWAINQFLNKVTQMMYPNPISPTLDKLMRGKKNAEYKMKDKEENDSVGIPMR